MRLLKRTYERIGGSARGFNGNEHTNGNEHKEVPQEATQPSTWQCAQAPSSCTLKWAFNGIELMLTLRDATDDALFCRIKKVLPKIEERMELQRQQRHERQQAQTPSPTNNGNGNGHKPADAAPPNLDDDPYCDFHDVPLKRYTKDGREWFSHFDAESGKWCRGK